MSISRARAGSYALVAALLVSVPSACTSRQDVLASKLRGRGSEQRYGISEAQAWTIARTLLKLESTGPVEEHRDEGYLLTSQHTEGLEAGTYFGVFIEPEGASAARITAVARRRSPLQSYAGLSEAEFHRKFADLLAMTAELNKAATSPSSSAPADTPFRADAGDAALRADAGDAALRADAGNAAFRADAGDAALRADAAFRADAALSSADAAPPFAAH